MKLLKLFAAGVIALAACSCGNAQTRTAKAADPQKAQTQAPAQASEAAEAPAVTVLAQGEQLPAVAKLPMVIDFNATWCGPCRKFAPVFDAAAEAYSGRAQFYSVDVDKHPRLAAQFGVQSIPTVAFLQPDGTVKVSVGYLSAEQLEAALAAAGITK